MSNDLTQEKKQVGEFFISYASTIVEITEKAILKFQDKMSTSEQLDKQLQAVYVRRCMINLINENLANLPNVIIDTDTTINQDYLVFKAPNRAYRIKIGKMAKDGLPATHNDTITSNNVNMDKGVLLPEYEFLNLSLLYSLDENTLELIKLHLVKMEGKEKIWHIDLLDIEKSTIEPVFIQNELSDEFKRNTVKPRKPRTEQNPLIIKK